MKAAPFLLAVSLVGNAGLGALALYKASDKPRLELPATTAPAITQGSTPGNGNSGEDSLQILQDGLGAADPQEQVRQIRSLPLSKADQDRLIRGLLMDHFFRTMNRLGETEDKPYWASGRNSGLSTPEVRLARRKLQFELMSLMREEGIELPYSSTPTAYRFLSKEKQQQLALLEQDYAEMRMVDNETSLFPLKADGEARRLLQEEREKDIAALLTPEEQQTLKLLRTSVANQVRSTYGDVVTSEEQYLQLQRLFSDYDEQRRAQTKPGERPENPTKAFQAMQESLGSQVEAILGAENMAKLVELNDPDASLMQAAIKRLELPDTAASQIRSVRDTIAVKAQEISASTMDANEKKAALKELARSSQTQLTALLGEEGAEVYVRRSAWGRALSKGDSFEMNAAGQVRSSNPGR